VASLLRLGADPNALCHQGFGFSFYNHTPLGMVVWRAEWSMNAGMILEDMSMHAETARLLVQAGASLSVPCVMNRAQKQESGRSSVRRKCHSSARSGAPITYYADAGETDCLGCLAGAQRQRQSAGMRAA
jgi:hypothetical protein